MFLGGAWKWIRVLEGLWGLCLYVKAGKHGGLGYRVGFCWPTLCFEVSRRVSFEQTTRVFCLHRVSRVVLHSGVRVEFRPEQLETNHSRGDVLHANVTWHALRKCHVASHFAQGLQGALSMAYLAMVVSEDIMAR